MAAAYIKLCVYFNIVKVNTRKRVSMLSVSYCRVDLKVSLPIRAIKASVLSTVTSTIIFSNSNNSNTIQPT